MSPAGDLMNAQEHYLWDLQGYLRVPEVLSARQLSRLRDAVALGRGNAPASLLTLPDPHGPILRELLVHPAVVARLNSLCGAGFRLDHGPVVFSPQAELLHGGGTPCQPGAGYHHQNAASSSDQVAVLWLLGDVKPGDGGLVLLPGSHKANQRLPDRVGCVDDLAVQQTGKAGDVLFYAEGALSWGVRPWRGAAPFHALVFRYAPRSVMVRVGSPDLLRPEAWWEADVLHWLTEEQRAVMYGPGLLHEGAIRSLIVDDHGNIRIDREDR